MDLISDIQCVVEQLWAFTPIARKHLPIQNGGFAGFSPEQCLASLKLQGIAVYGPCDLGAYGFTNCGLDEFASFDDALNAALQAHPEAVSMLSKETWVDMPESIYPSNVKVQLLRSLSTFGQMKIAPMLLAASQRQKRSVFPSSTMGQSRPTSWM